MKLDIINIYIAIYLIHIEYIIESKFIILTILNKDLIVEFI